MKAQLIGILLATAVSSTAFASENANSSDKNSGAMNFPSPSSAMGAGFENWAKDVLKYGGKGGDVLAGEVKSWVTTSNKIGSVSKQPA